MNNSVFRTRYPATAASGVPDQYADGTAARAWRQYIGGSSNRIAHYKEWLCDLLKENGVTTVIDVACGTGVDSVMLCDAGFHVWSVDASDKMLKYALRKRWNRRKQPEFDRWVIEEANWLSLNETKFERPEGGGFDAAICLGNSFAHLPDFSGDNGTHVQAIRNFYDELKPGGLLIIDHRNYDAILDTGKAPAKNLYYQGDRIVSVKTSVLQVEGQTVQVTLDYVIDVSEEGNREETDKFRLSYYPHRLADFTKILREVFGADAELRTLGDFKELNDAETPAYFIHVVRKPF